MNEVTKAIFNYVRDDLTIRRRIILYRQANPYCDSDRKCIAHIESYIESYFIARMLATSYALLTLYLVTRQDIDWRYIASKFTYLK